LLYKISEFHNSDVADLDNYEIHSDA